MSGSFCLNLMKGPMHLMYAMTLTLQVLVEGGGKPLPEFYSFNIFITAFSHCYIRIYNK